MSVGDTVLHLTLSRKYGKGTCRELVKRSINAGCATTARSSTGQTALEIAIERNLDTSVVELLLLPNVSLPPDSLLIAVQQGWTLEMVEHLIQRGADVFSTTSAGDTVLHLALNWKYDEEICRELVKRLINAGCNHNFTGKTALEMAMQHNLFLWLSSYFPLVFAFLVYIVDSPEDIVHLLQLFQT